MDHLCGARIKPAETDRVCELIASSGHEPLFAAAMARSRPNFAKWADDQWKGQPHAFMWEAEEELFGKMLDSWIQTKGVCVGMGFGRAIQDAVLWELAFGRQIGKLVTIAWEPTYWMSRHLPNTERWSGDGSVGAWAVQAMHKTGVVCRGMYGQYDLSHQQERLAVEMAEPRSRPPDIIAKAARPIQAAMRCMNTIDVRRALLAHYGVARCADRATAAHRDGEGFSGTVSSGGHCEVLRGVYLDHNNRIRFVENNSWPEQSSPRGGGPIKLWDGSTRQLPQGAGAIEEEDVDYYCKHGEVWAVAPPRLWRPAA